jgi:hypothetical protein
MAKKPKFTPSQIKEHVKKIQDAIDKQKRETQFEHMRFRSITPDEIEKKLKRANSPIIVGQATVFNAIRGGTVPYHLGIYNPDPHPASDLFAHVWVGSGFIDPTVGTFLTNVDTRFPRLTEPGDPGGLDLAPGGFDVLRFELNVPMCVERTNYISETCLMQHNFFDVGQYLDRAMFVFQVT